MATNCGSPKGVPNRSMPRDEGSRAGSPNHTQVADESSPKPSGVRPALPDGGLANIEAQASVTSKVVLETTDKMQHTLPP